MRRRKAPSGKPLIMSATSEDPLKVVSEKPGCCGQGSDLSLKLNLEARHQLSGHLSDGAGAKLNGTERLITCTSLGLPGQPGRWAGRRLAESHLVCLGNDLTR